eukprot:7010644-Pyramimonas_sp.AAC.1
MQQPNAPRCFWIVFTTSSVVRIDSCDYHPARVECRKPTAPLRMTRCLEQYSSFADLVRASRPSSELWTRQADAPD